MEDTKLLLRQISNQWIIDKWITEETSEEDLKKYAKELRKIRDNTDILFEKKIANRAETIIYMMLRYKKMWWKWLHSWWKSLLAYLWYFDKDFYWEEVLNYNEKENA